jgi:hypothetical protein
MQAKQAQVSPHRQSLVSPIIRCGIELGAGCMPPHPIVNSYDGKSALTNEYPGGHP